MSDIGEHEAPEETAPVVMPNKVYDFLKYVALVLLPALGTLYFALSDLWNLPNADQVVGTVMAVDTFLGVLLRYAKAKYDASGAGYDGQINVTETPEGKKLFSLEINTHPDDIQTLDQAVFKVNKSESPEA